MILISMLSIVTHGVNVCMLIGRLQMATTVFDQLLGKLLDCLLCTLFIMPPPKIYVMDYSIILLTKAVISYDKYVPLWSKTN